MESSKSKRTVNRMIQAAERTATNKPVRSSSDGSSKKTGQGTDIHPAKTGVGDNISTNLDLQEYVENKLRTNFQTITNTSFRRAAQMGGFVPDYILEDEFLQVPSLKKFNAVIFMTDISGFTKLTETYSLKGKGGTDQLTKTLASYMGPLAECILRTGGDIIKFAGDAFLSVWEVKQNEDFPELIQKVVDCALYCQEKYGSYVTDVSIVIRVKIGIGAGTCYAAGLGNDSYNHYAVFGPGVQAASRAEHHCVSGDVILHESAWKFCDPKQFSYESVVEEGGHDDSGYVKVFDIFHFINPTKRGRPIVAQRLNNNNNKNKGQISVPYSDVVRPSLDQNITTLAEERLRKYVIPPVSRKLDDDIPLDYLNESRMVSIVFIHVDVKPLQFDEQYGTALAEVVQSAFLIILRSCKILNGCLTKVIMFDKGLTYLVVFGLPGFTQDNQTASALHFAYKMKPALSAIVNVREVSIGVTTGSTYCGILGHARRHEYTVIGRKVNKAARLMCYYPGKVTCGQETFYNSKLPAHYFLLVPTKDLKGIEKVGKIYEYLGSEGGESDSIRRYEFPMLGRKSELNLILSTIQTCKQEFEKSMVVAQMSQIAYDTKSATELTSSSAWMIVLEGENGIGKSRLLATAMAEAEKLGMVVFSVVLTLQHVQQSLFAVANLIIQAFDMVGIRSPAEREEMVRKAASASGDPEIIQNLCTLNELLRLKLPIPQKVACADVHTRHAFTQHTIVQLLKIYYPNTMILLCVDGAQYMAQISWEYLNFISRLPSVLTMMTLRRNPDGLPKIPDMAYKVCYHSPHVKTISLSPLEARYMLPLACQLLEVKGIPVDLENILLTKSKGNPSWVENVLYELLNSEKIKIIDIDDTTKVPKKTKLNYTTHKHIMRQDMEVRKIPRIIGGLDAESEASLGDTDDFDAFPLQTGSSTKRTRVNPEKRICLVVSNTNISTEAVSGTIKEILLDTFDTLDSADQMMLKCASVLGHRFSHTMLNRLLPMYGRDAKKYLMSFKRLMEERFIRCSSRSKRNFSKSKVGGALEAIDCYCVRRGESYLDDYQNDSHLLQLPKYCYCGYAEFTKETMVDVVYELLTEDLKKELHLKAAKHLETTAILCVSCGGEYSAFIYGFDLKSEDLVAEDEEDIIAGANSRKRSSKTKSAVEVTASMRKRSKTIAKSKNEGGKRRSSERKRSSKKKQKRSLATRIHGLRRTLGSGGGQIEAIEIDILKSLFEFDQKNAKSCCWRKKKVDDDLAVSSIESMEVPEPGREGITDVPGGDGPGQKSRKDNNETKILYSGQGMDNVKKPQDGDPGVVMTAKSIALTSYSNNNKHRDSDEEDPDNMEDYDLRDCQCALIQAKICRELISRYRKAGKFGKTLMNLLDAVESVIIIGDCTKALSYLEEAAELREGFNSGLYPIPNLDDPDDVVLIEKETNTHMAFLSGLTYFELGAGTKAKIFFNECLKLLGTILPVETNNRKIHLVIKEVSFALWRKYHAPACCNSNTAINQGDKKAGIMGMKIRTLSYLQKIYKAEDKMNMALLVSLLQVELADNMGGYMHDEIPAYCNMMEMWTFMGKHKKAQFYEKKSLDIVRENLGSEDQIDPLGLLTSANLFLVLASVRLIRGELKSAIEASYLSLRIANILHDNALSCHLYPILITALAFTLQISEVMEAMQKLWYTSQNDDNWAGMATYFSLCMDLIMDLCCPVESFYYCEQFMTGKDWNEDVVLFQEFEIQYSFECSLALWYTRYSKWEDAKSWIIKAESHRPKVVSMKRVSGTLKLLQIYLISANFHQMKKRYQLFANDMNRSRRLMKELKNEIKVLPAFEPRYHHLTAYYWKIRERRKKTLEYLNRARDVAIRQGNRLEEEFVKHSRIVFLSKDNLTPNMKYFWLENSNKKNSVDWHLPSKIRWSHIMYTLPAASWSNWS